MIFTTNVRTDERTNVRTEQTIINILYKSLTFFENPPLPPPRPLPLPRPRPLPSSLLLTPSYLSCSSPLVSLSSPLPLSVDTCLENRAEQAAEHAAEHAAEVAVEVVIGAGVVVRVAARVTVCDNSICTIGAVVTTAPSLLAIIRKKIYFKYIH